MLYLISYILYRTPLRTTSKSHSTSPAPAGRCITTIDTIILINYTNDAYTYHIYTSHLSGPCRVARMKIAENLSTAKILRHIDDVDVEVCRLHSNVATSFFITTIDTLILTNYTNDAYIFYDIYIYTYIHIYLRCVGCIATWQWRRWQRRLSRFPWQVGI
jgi:hypothetical protein